MANNSQYPGMQALRPPRPPGPPPGAPPPMLMQYRQPVPVPIAPAPQSQAYNPLPPQQFQQVGRPNVGLPSHIQQFQFSQPVPQLPPRFGPGGTGLPQPPATIPVPEMHPNRPNMPLPPMPLQNPQVPNNYSAGLPGPRMPLSASYTFGGPLGGQAQRNADVPTQYQMNAQPNMASFPPGTQPWLPTVTQSIAPVAPLQHISEQSSAGAPPLPPPPPVAVADRDPPVITEPTPNERASLDWLEHTARNGKKYYYNKKSKSSTWIKPLDLMTPIERADATTDWQECKSPEGRKFYHNKVTNYSTWTMPAEVKAAREKLKMTATRETLERRDISVVPAAVLPVVNEPHGNAVTSTSSAHGVGSSPGQVSSVATVVHPLVVPTLPVEPSTSTPHAVGVQTPGASITPVASVSSNVDTSKTMINTDVVQTTDISETQAEDIASAVGGVLREVTEEADQGNGSVGKANITSSNDKSVIQEPLVYENKLEAKNAFKELLQSADVGPDWTWEQAMRVIINDKRYGALRTLGERKQAFNEFLTQRKKKDAEERRAKKKKAQEDFKTMLRESKDLTSSTRWSKAVTIFEDDERFKAVERHVDREDLFEDYMTELEKKEQAKAAEELKHNKMEYLNFLKSCDFITASSQWRKVQGRLEADERCRRLEKIDRMEVFQEYTRDLEREEEEQLKMRMEELRKAERKNREEFRKLIAEHVASGMLTAGTQWRDYCMKVKELPAYVAVSSNTSGSTAKDLFEDVAEELQKQYAEDKARIKETIKLRKIAVLSTWKLEDFKVAITEDIDTSLMSDNNFKIIFHELSERAKEKEEKEAKKRKHLADDFYNLLGTIQEITETSKWEDCKQILEERQEKWPTDKESFLKEVFDKHITELKEKEKEERRRRDDRAKRDKEKERKTRDEGRGSDKRSGKDRKHTDNLDHYAHEESIKGRKDKDRKHRKRRSSSLDELSADEDQNTQSKKSSRHSSDRKKVETEQRITTEHESESKYKRHRKHHRIGSHSHRSGDYEEHDGDIGDDGVHW